MWWFVAAMATEDVQITAHLLQVAATLRDETPSGLGPDQAARRHELLDRLEDYALVGDFPQHRGSAPTHGRVVRAERAFPGEVGRRPRFVDDEGSHCAVGYLVALDDPALALAVDAADPYGYVLEMEQPALERWAATHGFTLSELAWIQPNYEVPSPRCAEREALAVPTVDAGACEGWHLVLSSSGRRSDACVDGCYGAAGYEVVVQNVGTQPSPGTVLRIVEGDGATTSVPSLGPGRGVRVIIPTVGVLSGVRVEAEGGCGAGSDAHFPVSEDGMWAMLDGDGDGVASVACGGFDCDDGNPALTWPGCGDAPVAGCQASCAVYNCLERHNVTESPVAPGGGAVPAEVKACLTPKLRAETTGGSGCDTGGVALTGGLLLAALTPRRRRRG